MITIAIAPYAAKLPNGVRNPKDFPHWAELAALLNADGYEVIQLGVPGETRIDGVAQFIQGFPMDKLEQVVRDCATWIAVDSWLPHFCATMRLQPGIVIWSQSSPKIWGYPYNVNLLKGDNYLRQYQYAHWWDTPYREDAFVSAAVVREAVGERLRLAAA